MTYLPLPQAAEQARAWQKQGKTVVTTNGCFDLLHPGHIKALEAAKALGDVLIVALNEDASVKRLKGAERPFNDLETRAALMGALKPVDLVTSFAEDTPVEMIRAIQPNIHVKSGDYKAEDMPETAAVEAGGGKVVIVPLEGNYSSSKLIEKIKNSQSVTNFTRPHHVSTTK